MTPTKVFLMLGMIALPIWGLIFFLLKWKLTKFLINFRVIPLVLVVLYVIYIFQAIGIGGMMDLGSFTAGMKLSIELNTVLAG